MISDSDFTEWNNEIYGAEELIDNEGGNTPIPLTYSAYNRDIKESLRNSPKKIKTILKGKYDTVDIKGGQDDFDSFLKINVTTEGELEDYGRKNAEFENYLMNNILDN